MNVWLQGALFRNLRNAILFEDDSLEEFLKYPLVVLCGANMLSDEHLELLKKYCQQGGKLFICGTFGIYRPDGSRREHPEKVFGIKAELSDFVPTIRGKFTWKNQTVELSPQEESRIFEKICGETEIIAKTDNGQTVGISAMNSKFVWLTGGIGGRKPEDHFYDLRISRWLEVPGRANAQKNAEESLRNISGAILELLTERKPHITCSNTDYLATIFLSSDCKSGEIHLVNTSKVLPESGESVSHDDLFTNFLPGAAKNKQDISVTLCIQNKITEAKAYSPEFETVRDLKFSQNGDTVTIVIPENTFAGYLKIKTKIKQFD